MDSLGALHAFVRTAEARSFVVAARALGVSASAVGKAVARLEDRLGVRLFHRSTRSMTLTVEGTRYLERCRHVLAELEAAEYELTHARSAPRGKLRVSMPLVGMLLMPTVTQFLRTYPEIELDLDFTDRLVDVIDEGFDVVVRTGALRDSRLMSRTLGTFSHRLVGSPDYFAQHGAPQKPEELARHACLHHRYPSTGTLEPWPLRRGRKSLEVDLPTTMTASTLEPLLYLAEGGVGIACLPSFTVQKQLDEGRLLAVLADFLHDVGVFRILWPANRHPLPKTKVFVDFMATHLFRQPA